MVYHGLLEKIGFTDEMQAEYKKYRAMVPEKIDDLAYSYIHKNVPIEEINKELSSIETDILHKHTVKLLFMIECSGYLYEKYQEQGISDEIYFDTMRDFNCKIKECYDVNEVFGYDSETWFDGFFQMTRFGFGRLQFDITTHTDEDVEIADRVIKNGDFVVKCHIPSSGPLFHEDCIESYKAIYKFTKTKFEGDMLPIECHTWMLFPNYREFLMTKKNIGGFISDYKLFGKFETDKFYDAWRFFGKDADKEELPRNTSLQKFFADYIAPNKLYGYGKGIFLFDGENIIK